MNEEIKQPTLEELCKYFWELAKKYVLTEQGKKEIASVEFILKSEMLMNKVGTIETELNELKEFARIVSKKQVRIHWLKGACLERYNRDIKYNFEDYASNYMLTQSEFDLVKKAVEKYGR